MNGFAAARIFRRSPSAPRAGRTEVSEVSVWSDGTASEESACTFHVFVAKDGFRAWLLQQESRTRAPLSWGSYGEGGRYRERDSSHRGADQEIR